VKRQYPEVKGPDELISSRQIMSWGKGEKIHAVLENMVSREKLYDFQKTFIEYLLCARLCSEHFSCVN
jgi:hypothetical protein